ncbi:holin [Arthrobacter phage Wyborn]|uniref:Holin n=1 Tax=Arthrobacter phage Wyborn TaxID=3059067 RepID=A0AA96GXJ5_9CAUD|nr:holin [Arthrobacter phage Wyborn]
MTLSFWLVVTLFVSLLGVIALYAIFTRWRTYLAGWSLMTLLVSFALLVGFTIIARFFTDRALMYSLYNTLLVALIAAVLFIGGVMAYERFARNKEDVSND